MCGLYQLCHFCLAIRLKNGIGMLERTCRGKKWILCWKRGMQRALSPSCFVTVEKDLLIREAEVCAGEGVSQEKNVRYINSFIRHRKSLSAQRLISSDLYLERAYIRTTNQVNTLQYTITESIIYVRNNSQNGSIYKWSIHHQLTGFQPKNNSCVRASSNLKLQSPPLEKEV